MQLDSSRVMKSAWPVVGRHRSFCSEHHRWVARNRERGPSAIRRNSGAKLDSLPTLKTPIPPHAARKALERLLFPNRAWIIGSCISVAGLGEGLGPRALRLPSPDYRGGRSGAREG